MQVKGGCTSWPKRPVPMRSSTKPRMARKGVYAQQHLPVLVGLRGQPHRRFTDMHECTDALHMGGRLTCMAS